MLQPANVATPEEALSGLAVHVSVPPPGFVPIARVIGAELPVTGLPTASSTVTTGCVAHAVPPVPPPGCVVNTSWVAVPAVIVKGLLVALVSPLLVAASVYPLPALRSLQHASDLTPSQ